MAKIYVASSWRNTNHQRLISQLRDFGHKVYDFTKPNGEEMPSVWDGIHLNNDRCSSTEYAEAISNPEVIKRYNEHYKAMTAADTCILLLPCGNSAHAEAGFMSGMSKRVFVFSYDNELKPELMYRLFDGYTNKIIDLLMWLKEPFSGVCRICGRSEDNDNDTHEEPLTWVDKDKTICTHCAKSLLAEHLENEQDVDDTSDIFR